MYHCTLWAAQTEAPPTGSPLAYLLMIETYLSFIFFLPLKIFRVLKS